ncbi:hypothetical protein K437DRAFT_269234 [Tilletiaria anomala UBC 951]|uniref:Uncharacterized protein n=1 Tax=Tilletiaria anomala (strain ATCC 24038 / CBS 436.72 / UBC 951) TaxID=1037660 RepID=A0A066VRU2_TILAU|nr:uncharacterized protein K437DRAFT_269234 [Tilletiaria anomala UBC 951]KDN42983.1 hypothetical protein K437DRAFT_269234 [Tilletiaria anomala UBC 951]
MAATASMAAEIGDLDFNLVVPVLTTDTEKKQEAGIGSLRFANVWLEASRNIVSISGRIDLEGGGGGERGALARCTSAHHQDPERATTPVPIASAARTISRIPWLAATFAGARMNATLPPLGDRARLVHDMSPVSSCVREPTAAAGAITDSAYDPGPLFALKTLVHLLGSAAVQIDAGGVTTEKLSVALNPGRSALVGLLRLAARREAVSLGIDLEEVPELKLGRNGPSRTPNIHGDAGNRGEGVTPDPVLRRKRTLSALASATLPSEATSGLPALLVHARAHLSITAYLSARVLIGSYALPQPINFKQEDLCIAFTQQVPHAISPDIGKPIVFRLLEQAQINVERIKVRCMSADGIGAAWQVKLESFDLISASVHFPHWPEIAELEDDGQSGGRVVVALEFLDDFMLDPQDQRALSTNARIRSLISGNASNVTIAHAQIPTRSTTTRRTRARPMGINTIGVTFDSSLEEVIFIAGLSGLEVIQANNLSIGGENREESALLVRADAQVVTHAPFAVHLAEIQRAL